MGWKNSINLRIIDLECYGNILHSRASVATLPPMKRQLRTLLADLPNGPGVYLFYGTSDYLLYVGKSKTIRTRVRSHFASPDERVMCRQVVRMEARETAGELGALLLESQLIKELRPQYNVMSRHKRRLIIARRITTDKGYASVVLEAVDTIDPRKGGPIMAIFKTRTQAKDFLATSAREYGLCPAVLGLERTTRFCFWYHLKQCGGACGGLETVEDYNARFEEAFERRRIKAWPFPGTILIEESTGAEGEIFLIDHWCLLYSFVFSHTNYKLHVRGAHRFDYDSYRILAGYVLDEENRRKIRQPNQEELNMLLRLAAA